MGRLHIFHMFLFTRTFFQITILTQENNKYKKEVSICCHLLFFPVTLAHKNRPALYSVSKGLYILT